MNEETEKALEQIKGLLTKDIRPRKFAQKIDLQLRLNKKFLPKQKGPLGNFNLPFPFKVDRAKILTMPGTLEAFIGDKKKLKRGIRGFNMLVMHKDAKPLIKGYEAPLSTYGISPNEKAGTLTNNVEVEVDHFVKSGKTIIFPKNGQLSFAVSTKKQKPESILENVKAAIRAVISHGTGPKQFIIERAYLHVTMGRSIRLNLKELIE